ncbi:hypothetical protein [Sorangium sp. So ce1000]|uniref:hypothetical protein n=1 Tax=Sorangium sp. So ce1000 TaxID=3133325 RepID=UPI003F61323A
MVQDDQNDVARPELPVEVAVAVLDELRGVQALLGEAERTARAAAERLRAVAGRSGG